MRNLDDVAPAIAHTHLDLNQAFILLVVVQEPDDKLAGGQLWHHQHVVEPGLIAVVHPHTSERALSLTSSWSERAVSSNLQQDVSLIDHERIHVAEYLLGRELAWYEALVLGFELSLSSRSLSVWLW